MSLELGGRADKEGNRYEDRFFVTYFIYFLLGCIMAEHMEQFQTILKKYKWIVYALFIFFTYWLYPQSDVCKYFLHRHLFQQKILLVQYK